MEMLSAAGMAEKWGLSVRTVQNMCRSDKIPGAVLFGKSWMIPANALRPADGRQKSVPAPEAPYRPLIRRGPFLDMTDLYQQTGTAEACIEALKDFPREQLLFEAEIAYSRGRIDQVYQSANHILSNHSGLYAVIAGGLLLSLCAMWTGDVKLWYSARQYLYNAPCKTQLERDIVQLTMAACDSGIRNTGDFPDWFTRGCFDNLHRDAHPAARVYYIKYLMISAQELAVGSIQLDGIQGLGLMRTLPYIIEPMISQMVVDKIVMAEIYLRLLVAIAYHQIGDDDRSATHLDKAIRMCLADGLYGPLVEHRRQLGLFLDDRLAQIDPEALKTVKNLHKQLHVGWTRIHNAVMERQVQVSLSIREREVARLAAFGLSNQSIARQLSLSEHTVISLVNSAKNKTGVDHRSQLGLYI